MTETASYFGYTTLADGEVLERRYTVLSRAWYGPANLAARYEDIIDRINIGHFSNQGGTTGEFEIALDKIGLKVEVWDDAWHLFHYEAELFDKLAQLGTKPALSDVETVLQRCGFIDATPTVDSNS